MHYYIYALLHICIITYMHYYIYALLHIYEKIELNNY